MDAGSWISLIVKFCGFIKSIFWKNKILFTLTEM